MHVLVYPHDLEVGGSQLNAIDLAGAVAAAGHRVTVFGVAGALVGRLSALGLDFVAAPVPGRRPSGKVVAALTDAVRERNVDLVHAYEWPPAIEATIGPRLRLRVPVVTTVMSMGVAPFMPRSSPLIVGTRAIERACALNGHPEVHLIEPPVDTHADAPDQCSPENFTRRWRLSRDDFVVVVVSRLAKELKREGLLQAVHAAGALATRVPIRLVIVGDGPARAEVEACAREVNASAGREVVTLTGLLTDPRSAYAAADVVLGMGSSALRGMAFGKPLVVQGEASFWSLLSPETLPVFLEQGWYGVGDGVGGVARLTSLLRDLHADSDERRRLGQFARAIVQTRFSLDRALQLQLGVYEEVLRASPRLPTPDLVRCLAGLSLYKVKRRVQRVRGTVATDDFNARARQPALVRG